MEFQDQKIELGSTDALAIKLRRWMRMFSVRFFHQIPKNIKRKDKCPLPVKNNIYVWMKQRRPRTSSSASERASLTLEAACVIPIFFYAILAFLYFIPAAGVQGSVMASLWETGKELAVYAYAVESGEGASGLVSGALSAGYAKGKVTARIKEENVNTSVVQGGGNGISMAGSSFGKNDMIRLIATYHLKFPLPLFSLKDRTVVQEIAVRAWTGRKETWSDSSGADGQTNVLVYITADGKVYHKDQNCSHIRLSVRQIDKGQVSHIRNEGGGKYYPCEGCGNRAAVSVYITDTGDRYHSSVNCRGLKRTVMEVPVSGLDGWRACSRCGG